MAMIITFIIVEKKNIIRLILPLVILGQRIFPVGNTVC